MSKRSPLPQDRHHVMVYDEDWEYLQRHYGPASANKIGVGPAIKEVIHAYVKNLKAKAQRAIDSGAEAVPVAQVFVPEDAGL
jgi:hypothetical protein